MPSANIDRNHDDGSLQFELDPFISEVVLWIDADIVEERREFKFIKQAARLQCICEKLIPHGIAVMQRSPNIAWLPTAALLKEYGRSDVVPRMRYNCSISERKSQDRLRYEKAVEKELRLRLGFIVRRTVAAFQCFNAGFTFIASRGRDGSIQWGMREEGKVVAEESQGGSD